MIGGEDDMPPTNTPSGPDPLMNVEAAARLCGCSTSFLNRLRLTGGGPAFVKLGRRVAYDPADLRVWLASCRRTPTSQLKAA